MEVFRNEKTKPTLGALHFFDEVFDLIEYVGRSIRLITFLTLNKPGIQKIHGGNTANKPIYVLPIPATIKIPSIM